MTVNNVLYTLQLEPYCNISYTDVGKCLSDINNKFLLLSIARIFTGRLFKSPGAACGKVRAPLAMLLKSHIFKYMKAKAVLIVC